MLAASVHLGTCITPAVFPVDSGIDFILQHSLVSAGSVRDLPLGFALASVSRRIQSRYIFLPCVVLSYVFGLLAPGSLPRLEGMGFVAGLWVG